MCKFVLSAFADEYSPEFDEQLEVLSQNGFSCIEPRFIDKINVSDLSNEKLAEVKAKLNNAGISVSAIGSPLGKINLDDDFNAHLDKTKRTCEIARELGTDKIRVFSFYLPQGKTREECRNKVLDNLTKMLDIADSYGIELYHENEARIYGESPEQCNDLLTYFGGRLKCVFDMGNFVLGGYKPEPGYELLKEHVGYFHIKDATFSGNIVPAGKGEACIKDILYRHLNAKGGDIIITLEPHLQLFSGLKNLTGEKIKNPYSYPDCKTAFTAAIRHLKEIL